MAITQKDRHLTVKTELGDDVLLIDRFIGTEHLGKPFEYELELLSESREVDVKKVLGTNATVSLVLPNNEKRYFNGFVSRFEQTGVDVDHCHFRATLVPWLWFLTRTSNCRIFQDMAVPDIIKQVFRDYGYSDFEDGLSEDYREWEYCAQYRESAFHFVSRLMEQEGIYYFFKHEDGIHKLVLADSMSNHDDYSGYDQIKYLTPKNKPNLEEYISSWSVRHEVRSGEYRVTDYNFKTPGTPLLTSSQIDREHSASDFEMYDYPGEFEKYGESESFSKRRIQELQADFEVASGDSNARGISCGSTFKFTDYLQESQCKKYLFTSVRYDIRSNVLHDQSTGDETYSCHFTAIDHEGQFRSPRITPTPIVSGPDTAVVVGNESDKVHADEYGRVKIQFHWDREGKHDANSSCWVRVSQNWAGKSWGGMFIPHVGQEVIVEFLNGDPDRPIITGRVYNADNMPPEKLPGNKHKSVLRDDYGNEMIFDATPDDEHIRIYSPHHQSGLILGRSIFDYTSSNKASFTTGNNATVTTGFTHAVYGGIRTQTDIGFYLENAWGSKVTSTAGTQVNFTAGLMVDVKYSKEYEYNMKDFSQKAGGGMKFDSEKSIDLIAAPDDAAQLKMNQDGIVLEYEEKPGAKAKPVVPGSVKTAIGGALATALALPLTSEIMRKTQEGYYTRSPDHEEYDSNEGAYDTENFQAHGTVGELGGGLVGVLGLLLGAVGTWGKEDPAEKLEPDSKIAMSKDGILIKCGKTTIDIKKDGNVSIFGSNDINLFAEGEIKLTSKKGKPISMKTSKVKVDAEFAHKNLVVTK